VRVHRGTRPKAGRADVHHSDGRGVPELRARALAAIGMFGRRGNGADRKNTGERCQATLILTPSVPVLIPTPIMLSFYRFLSPFSGRFSVFTSGWL
jgi:hypothetical protein